METSTLRFGRGIVREVGHDLEDLGAKRVAVVTDPRLSKSIAFERAMEALDARGLESLVYDQVRCEPTDTSMRAACEWARAHGPIDAFLAIGGGSSIDTAKCANLMSCHPHNDLDDFVNAPIGKGLPIPNPLKPLVAVVTTAGTGSEATGTAIFDHLPSKAKTGIGHRCAHTYSTALSSSLRPHILHRPLLVPPHHPALSSTHHLSPLAIESYACSRLRPTLGIVDPDLVGTLPSPLPVVMRHPLPTARGYAPSPLHCPWSCVIPSLLPVSMRHPLSTVRGHVAYTSRPPHPW